MEQGLSRITLMEIDDQIQIVDKKVVAIAILAEKTTKLTAMRGQRWLDLLDLSCSCPGLCSVNVAATDEGPPTKPILSESSGFRHWR